jgi:hypothetical protein
VAEEDIPWALELHDHGQIVLIAHTRIQMAQCRARREVTRCLSRSRQYYIHRTQTTPSPIIQAVQWAR